MPLTTADRLEIQELYARYNHAIDSGNGEAWAACFTPSGTFKSGSGSFAGTEQLAGFATAFAARVKGRHWTNNLVLDDAPGGATGTCYLALLRLTPGEKPPATIMTTAIYTDTLAMDGSAWKFASRVVSADA